MDEDVDGVLVGWRRSQFQLVRSEVVELRHAADAAPTPTVAARAAARDDVAVMVGLVPFNDARHDCAMICCSTQFAGGHAGDRVEPTDADEEGASDRALAELRRGWRDEEGIRACRAAR